MALKKCLKVHKLFVAEVERCARLEKEGEQVLSSLANVSQRLPLLVDSDSVGTNKVGRSTTSSMGVLSHCVATQELLLQKHFLALEKSMTFLGDILKEYVDVVRRMKSFAGEYMDLLDFLEPEDNCVVPNQQLEWMDSVVRMFEHELLRKRSLVADVEYHDALRLKQMHAHWSIKTVHSNVDYSYA
uniref:Uncharacterized protein n=1 Tax=Globisporangium ultimum (strain ATCC 200006 / CBS 805.95 / DAOM BR144) TaxID=431595 RepID=K3X9K2_GLOUD